jgi:hypothetical protein
LCQNIKLTLLHDYFFTTDFFLIFCSNAINSKMNLLRRATTHLPTTSIFLHPRLSHFFSTNNNAHSPIEKHKPNSPLTVGVKTFRKRHQKRYKRRARQTQLNNKIVKQQKQDALQRRDMKRVKRWREAAAFKQSLVAQIAATSTE